MSRFSHEGRPAERANVSPFINPCVVSPPGLAGARAKTGSRKLCAFNHVSFSANLANRLNHGNFSLGPSVNCPSFLGSVILGRALRAASEIRGKDVAAFCNNLPHMLLNVLPFRNQLEVFDSVVGRVLVHVMDIQARRNLATMFDPDVPMQQASANFPVVSGAGEILAMVGLLGVRISPVDDAVEHDRF